MFGKLFHRWLNPHCPDCNRCASCETLSGLLESERRDKNRILDLLMAPKEIVKEVPIEGRDLQQVSGPALTWNQKRRTLEQQVKSQMLRDNELANEKLVKTQGIDELERAAGIAE